MCFSKNKCKCAGKCLAALALLVSSHAALAADTLADSVSLEAGSGPKVRMIRAGLQSDWGARWFRSNGAHLSGYWDLSLAQWRGSAHQNQPGRHQNITNLGFTPVFRYQRDDKLGWYAEAGIGVNLLSELYDNDGNRLSTAFQFGDHIGAGYVFDNKWEVGAKLQHFSNGGIKRPNSGANFVILKASRRF
jgi:hypothetical protein